LSKIKVGQQVTVKIDTENEMKSLSRNSFLIASSAEFTPKIIQKRRTSESGVCRISEK
jgi:HlyD family secretion protein